MQQNGERGCLCLTQFELTQSRILHCSDNSTVFAQTFSVFRLSPDPDHSDQESWILSRILVAPGRVRWIVQVAFWQAEVARNVSSWQDKSCPQ